MAEDITFVVHGEWLDSIANLPIADQDKIIADIVRYGTENETVHDEDYVISSVVNLLKGRIDFSKNKYTQKVEMAKGAGRKKKIDDEKIYWLAREGNSSAEIAALLGVSKSAVDHSEGWRRRKEDPEIKNETKNEFNW